MSRLSHFLRNRGLVAEKPGAPINVGRHLFAPPLSIDVDVDEATMRLLFERVASVWSKLGATDPYWSVLVDEAYRSETIAQNKNRFFKSGSWDAKLIAAFLARAGAESRAGGVCLELGCGVGRVTSRLADMFESVIAADVSKPHLQLAAERLATLSRRNVTFVHLQRLEELSALPVFDFFYSRIVLQHNPPPVMAHMLGSILERLSPGGYCLFQLPTYRDSYRFAVTDYLASRPAGMEMHCLPQRCVHDIFRRHGIDAIETVEDQSAGIAEIQSTIFFGRKSISGGADDNPA